MKGDFTRMTFDSKNHYHGVLMQQGRVQLDADWNEQVDIQAHRVETETRDVIGQCGTPIDQPGFTLIVDATVLSAADQARLTQAQVLPLSAGDFLIGPGRYYVDGSLIENEDYVLYTQQPDYPGDDPKNAPDQPTLEIKRIVAPALYLAYLDVWERHITALDDDRIREKALDGPDTATRAKTIWQVKIKQLDSATRNCLTAPLPKDESTGQLSARSKPVDDQKDDCEVPPGAGYRRLENQLYRVEIHTGGNEQTATFKWSRDNASQVMAWSDKNGNDLTVSGSGPDEVLGFAPNQWVELCDDLRDLHNQPGTLVKLVTAVGPKLTIDPNSTTDPVERNFFPLNPKIRRWEGTRKVNAKDTVDGFIRLEDGVEIKFEAGQYRTGDYWLIPARTARADVEWPKAQSGEPMPQVKRGIDHHTCALGLLNFDNAKNLTVQADCRPFFPNLTDFTGLYYVGGDGQEGQAGKALPKPLKVGVANGNHPVANARVEFAIWRDNDTVVSTTTVNTDTHGLAEFKWTLGASNELRVRAQLLAANNQAVHLPVIFSAQYEQVEVIEPGIYVKGIQFINGPQFLNDTDFPVTFLANGLQIECGDRIEAASVHSQPTGDGTAVSPTVYVTLDLPYPFNAADRELWGEAVVAYQPVNLASNVSSDGNVIFWGPTDATRRWLTERLFQMMNELKRGQRILAHLTLNGNFIWGEKGHLQLDGDVFGAPGINPATGKDFNDAQLPSGDKRRGGDLEMWFWLNAAEQPRRVVLLGNPATATFKLSTTRQRGLTNAVNFALDRTKLRDVVPPEYDLDMNRLFDLPKAQELAVKHNVQGLKFRTWVEKPLLDAAQMIMEMLTPLDISMGPEQVDDLVTRLTVAVAAGDAPEAVLVDAAFTGQLNKLDYTYEIVTL